MWLRELRLDWKTVKSLEMEYMREQLRRAGTPGPKVIGIDEISVGRGHNYRIIVSDLVRGRPIWFGGTDRSEKSMDLFYEWLGPRKCKGIRLAVMDMWKAFRNSTLKAGNAPQAGILYDKFHILKHLNEALDKVRKSEYARLSGKDRRFIKGQKYTLLSRRANLSQEGRQSLKALFKANRRLNKAYLLKEMFNEAPRPEAEVSGRPPRGGRFRAVAPLGGGHVGKAPLGPTWLLEVELSLTTLQLLLLADVLDAPGPRPGPPC